MKQKIQIELENMGFDESCKIINTDKKQDLSSPLEYYFDFTYACNLNCTHCYNRDFLNSATMTEEQIEYIIKDMYDNGIMRLHLAGGEPTLFPEKLRKYMATAREYGIVTSMSSNGTLVTEEIADILIENDVTSFTVSIESADEEKNSTIRGKNVLELAKDGIRKIVKYKTDKKGDFCITIKMSYDLNTTREDFEKMVELAIELKVDILKLINPERCTFHEKGYYGKNVSEYYKVQEIIREIQEKYKNKINITMVNSPVNLYCSVGIPGIKGCIGAQELVAINPNGDVTPCLMNKYYLGNIFEDKTIKNIYLGKKIEEYKQKITDYDCGDCEYHSQCRGGCQIRKIVQFGKITGTDPICPIKNKQLTKKVIKEKQKYKNFKKVNVYHSL